LCKSAIKERRGARSKGGGAPDQEEEGHRIKDGREARSKKKQGFEKRVE